MPAPEAARDYIHSINTRGYLPVQISLSGADIDPLFASFREVVHDIYDSPSQHGRDVIDGLAVILPERPGDSSGFINQRRLGELNPYEPDSRPATENKDIFHFTPRTAEHFTEHMRTRGGVSQAMRSLLDQCVALHEEVKKGIRPALMALGVSDYILSPRGYEEYDIHHLRLLRYLGSTVTEASTTARQDALAQLHLDRSKLTAAVWESATGLVGATANNALGSPNLTVAEFDQMTARALASPIKHRSGEIKLFVGAGYNRLPGEVRHASGNLQPLLHGVVDDNPGHERDAVVVFLNETALHTDCSVPTKSETSYEGIRQALLDREREAAESAA